MPATTSGRIIKSRKGKKGTAHQKNHRWESFTTKISKLNSLDPLRRVRRHDLDAEDTSATTSYFRAGLEKWAELNLSSPFISFAEEVLPLCDSLPQILHFEDKIMGLFVTYIEGKQRESLEPLLELITDFAHDLGPRFEKHYAKALELVTSIAGTIQDVAVIEWSFTCLAFLFKYLSKLIVPDLRPTYDLMAPLLGRHRQPPHIARFAAEAMSFLIKKAGAPAHREKALPLIIHHAKSDLLSIADTKQFGLYYHGIMTLFAEAMKGNGMSVHTSGPAIFKSLFLAIEESDFGDKEALPWVDVICGVLTSIIHHATPETFKEVLELVLEEANTMTNSFTESKSIYNFNRILLSARTMGIVTGVRRASRVQSWPNLLQALSNILKAVSKNASLVAADDNHLDLWKYLIQTTAIALTYSPMDSTIPFISPFMDALTKDPLAKWFLTFCSYLSQGEPERFRTIALPYFQRFIVTHWSDAENGDTLCVLLPKMVSSGVLPSQYGKDAFFLPQSWQGQIVSKFERLEQQPFPEQVSPATYNRSPTTWHDRCLPKYNALLEILECTAVHPSTNARIAEILLRKLKLALRPSSSLAPEEAHFIVGRGFSSFSRMTKGAGEVDRALEPLLRAAAPRYARLPNFLEALLGYKASLKLSPKPDNGKTSEEEDKSDLEAEFDLLVRSLVENLSSESNELRLLSLRLLEHIHDTDHGVSSEAISLMIMIEQTPLDLQSARSASMHIRKLASIYTSQMAIPWMKYAIPSFCFGMLTVKMAQIWEDASAALKHIAESKVGEEAVAVLTFKWLETPSVRWSGPPAPIEKDQNNGLTDFECSNLNNLDKLAKETDSEVLNARDTMLQKFEVAQQLVEAQPRTARSQALRVLAAVPMIGERRSRQLIPMFLSWAGKVSEELDATGDEDEAAVSDWTRKDQKSLLDVLGFFVNPRSIFKSDEVYEALLRLLANGDLEIQKSALKAVLTWKNKSVKPYQENLTNLLDEARFKDEITILLQGQTLVQPEHREALLPILLRLLYGRTISRKGAGSGKQGMEARRLTVLRNLSVQDIGGFLDIALGNLKDLDMVKEGAVQMSVFEKKLLGARKQLGFTNMMEAVLKELATKVVPLTRKLLEAVLYCLVIASRQLQGESVEETEDDEETSKTSLFKVVRQTGLKCLILLFNHSAEFDWSPYVDLIVTEIVLPRIDNLPIETAQGVSGLLRLFYAWSSSMKTVLLLGSNDQILLKVAECLAPAKSKDEVKLFALSIIRSIVKCAQEEEAGGNSVVKNRLLTPNMDHFLIQIGGILRNQNDMSKDLLECCVETVSELAPFVSNSTQGRNLVDVSVFFLDQPSRRVTPKTKAGLLLVLEHFVPLYDLQNDADLKDRVYHTVTSLFGFFKDKISREVLSRVLLAYSDKDPVLKEVAALCSDLNSFADGRLDEPDYDRRLKAFNAINAKRDVDFNSHQWTPLLFNMLFYIKHDEEFGILSSNSSDGACRFIETARDAKQTPESSAFQNMLSTILIPALFAGVREPSEIVRREYMKVAAHLVRNFPEWSEVSDMHKLLAGEDEVESSFFNNILAAGKGRQSSAFGLLSSAAEKGELSSKNVSHFFIPLIEHFIFDRAEGSDGHNLAAEATTTVGILARSLEWPQYRAMLKRFIGYVQAKPDLEKQVIRLLGKVIDALALAAQPSVDTDMETDIPKIQSKLAITMPKEPKFSDDLTSNILPSLTDYLHDKDESTVSLRVPVAIIVVRLLQLLPQEKMNERLPAVLTDICHILRSKAQESRDLTRDTLVKICVLLGPSCFGFVLKELRSALARGSQLHVLSYTMHSMLVATTPEYAPGDLDYCLPSIVAIIMDDIFGAVGQEKDEEGYISKMKEVKSSKSHDSMELIAKTATLSRLTDLIHPIRVLLKEKLNIRMVRKIDELLNRISSGLLKNRAAGSRDSLVFCYEVIQDVYNSQKPQAKKGRDDYRLKRYLLQKGAKRGGDRGATTIYTYKLIRFAFDVMRSVLKKHDTLRTPSNLAGFIPIIGDAIAQGEEEIKVAAFKLLGTIVKVPLKIDSDGTNLYRVATAEAIKCISGSSSTTSDIAQAALKLISAVLRDRKDVPVKERSVDDILERMKDDMTEPERRHVTFNFLRAVLDSKVETAVVYDTLDYVGTVMVTNDDKDTRDLARGAYFHFLRDFPQKKSRWTKQLEFIVANLKYEREGGRLSILEVIHLLLSKSSHDFVQEVSATCFVPLIFVLANDDSEKCRMAAGEVLKEIFKRADEDRMTTFLVLLRSWIKQSENTSVVRLAFQTYGFYYNSQSEVEDTDVKMLLASVSETIESASDHEADWELIYAALQLTATMCQKFPEALLSSKTSGLWSAVRVCLSYPHAWVKLSAARLTSTYFADFARTNAEAGLEGLPLRGSHGLKLSGDDISDFIRRIVGMYKTPGLTELLAEEILKNLIFLGRCAGTNNLKWKSSQKVDAEEEELAADEEGEEEEAVQNTALQYLFGRLSFILRRETSPPRAPTLIPKTSSLQLLQILCTKLEPASLIPSLRTILLPLHNLTDPSISMPYSTDDIFRANYEALKSSSEELLETLKRKVGTQDYSEALLKVREGVKEKRAQRSGKRKIAAVSQPEKFGEEKRRKGERKKEKRKERGAEHSKKRNMW
ncbi:hypothetical protein DSL72_006886 [Monilinia vaccinii-corymbosi]|uniref:Uncharacterized protein n=1 Tax=Monilinia vaccinii-corymbosi TaxID=61207 RepID=A0A8A3PLC3_9HELO|nr:hypothetical protein DSL72_006886 [Monilinia vaccinii-corymbosi]